MPENKGNNLVIVIIVIVLILIPLGYSIVGYVFARDDDTKPFLQMPDEKYTECVRDTEYMRYHHWELLRGIREEIVRYGKRGEINLNKCRECHTSRENFCNACHNAVSLKPDCFGCHYYPEHEEEVKYGNVNKVYYKQ